MSPFVTIAIILIYFSILMVVSKLTTGKSENNSNFFIANRQSKWYLVAIGMIGSSVSGISLVSVPGLVVAHGFTYLQMCLGFIVGYIVVAKVLLPIYYNNSSVSIYQFLEKRFGIFTHKTGSWFFIISKIITSASKLYVAVLVLQTFLFNYIGVPIWLSAIICVMMIFAYTFKGGIRTIVFTDALQTVVLLLVVVLMLFQATKMLGISLSISEIYNTIEASGLGKTFVFFDFMSDRNFFKQFFSGVFIVIVMTGLNQDMLQTTLSCRSLKDAQKNMYCYGAAFVPLNFMLLMLGSLIVVYARQNGIDLPQKADEIIPMFASNLMGNIVYLCFVFGIIAATFNVADSALTGILTSFMADIIKVEDNSKKSVSMRKIIYFVLCSIFAAIILLFNNLSSKSIIDTIYMIVGYAYGPLLGIFAFGIFTSKKIIDKLLPFVALASPIITYFIAHFFHMKYSYKFGYEILLLNGLLMFIMLLIIEKRKD